MPIQNVSWKGPLMRSDVAHQLKTALLGARETQLAHQTEALMAETLRVAVWALNMQKPDALRSGTTASTRRVLAHARAMWEPLREEIAEQSRQQNKQVTGNDFEETLLERETLDRLEEQGDILSLPGGYWLPAPVRIVPVSKAECLVVGGLPTRLLPSHLLKSLHFHSSFRRIYNDLKEPLPTGVYIGAWQFQSLNNWLGPTPPTLDQLIQFFSSRTLLPVSQQNIAVTPLEAYAAYIDKPQALRWQSVQEVKDGRHLLRTSTWWGTKQYSIGEIENRRLVRQSNELHPSHLEVRRLCYALDWEMKTPTTAKFTRNMLTLWSELPVRERRMMAAIATLTPGERYYPRIWSGITNKQLDRVSEMLRQLGITIITEDIKQR